jgi:hypothetical protein
MSSSLKLLEQCNAYNNCNETDKKQIVKFIDDIAEDFDLQVSYRLKDIIDIFDTDCCKYMSYLTIFTNIYKYSGIMSLTDNVDKLRYLIIKYNNVKINLPFNVSDHSASLSLYLFNLIKENVRPHSLKDHNKPFEIFKVLVPYLPNQVSMVIGLCYGTATIESLTDYAFVIDDEYDMKKYSKYNRNTLLFAKFFKLLIEHHTYDKEEFSKLLKLLYCRQDMISLNIIKQYKPELLSINTEQLVKIIFYGRNESMLFVIENLRNEFNEIIALHNPYDISLIDDSPIDIISDIWNGWCWYNDECDKPLIGTFDFDEIVKLMNSNTSCVFEYSLKLKLLKELMNMERYEQIYFVTIKKLIEMCDLNILSKNDIKKIIESVGLTTAWELIKYLDDGNVLTLIVD